MLKSIKSTLPSLFKSAARFFGIPQLNNKILKSIKSTRPSRFKLPTLLETTGAGCGVGTAWPSPPPPPPDGAGAGAGAGAEDGVGATFEAETYPDASIAAIAPSSSKVRFELFLVII